MTASRAGRLIPAGTPLTSEKSVLELGLPSLFRKVFWNWDSILRKDVKAWISFRRSA